MRIVNGNTSGSNLDPTRGTGSTEKVRSRSAGSAKGAGLQNSVDKVDVSDVAAAVNFAMGVDQTQREEKVAELSRLMNSGQFHVDADSLSEAILSDEENNAAPPA